MTKVEGLHTLVRTYCIDAIAFWKKEYAEKRTGSDFPEYTYSDSDYNLFPRYNALDAILKGIELLVPTEYRDFKTLKKDIIEVALENETAFTNNPDNDIEEKAIKEERVKFKAYVESLKESDVKDIEPLPLRRRLKTNEKMTVRQMLHEVWGYDGDYWEPLGKKSPKETVFLLSKYITDGDRLFIKELLAKKGGKHLYEVNETGDDYETDLESISSFYQDHEVMYFDETYKWAIYGSHEETITFGGEWLINSIKERFKDRPELINSWN
ncbi:hypothetical protein [Niastella sp. OAS944]|uniref:hypothetical protein n=1 Tax=Niastella sp. OAS944 TaxID=2664089 RepID=UPI00347D971F|nr:hypothetical protein [Chitinophagaceae bacterium OAS944]